MRPQMRGFLTFLVMLMLAACATQPAPPTAKLPPLTAPSDAEFPAPAELQPQVAFWQKVYSTW